MLVAVIEVYRDKPPHLDSFDNSTAGWITNTEHDDTRTSFVIRCGADIVVIEEYQGPWGEAVRGMAAELHKLFPTEPEAECFRYVCEWNAEKKEEKLSVRLRCEVIAESPYNAQRIASGIFREMQGDSWRRKIILGYITVTLAKPEAEPEEEYILRHDDGEKAIPCGDCGFLIETKWAPAHSKYHCEVCTDLRAAEGHSTMCHQTNVLLAAIEKSRPVEGELATPAELRLRDMNLMRLGSLRNARTIIQQIWNANSRIVLQDNDSTDVVQLSEACVIEGMCNYVSDVLNIFDSEEP